MEPEPKEIVKESSGNSNLILPASILAAGLMVSASIIYLVKSNNPPTQAPAQNPGQTAQVANAVDPKKLALTSNDVPLGNANAPVTIIEYGDYQCPYCEFYFRQVEPTLKQNYVTTDKARFIFRNLAFLDQRAGSQNESHLAAEAAYCAQDQNQFWAYHDALYAAKGKDTGGENDGLFSQSFLVSLAKNLNLNTSVFSSCLASGKYASQVNEDNQNAAAVGVDSTPTTFVNGKMVVDAQGGSVGVNSAPIFQAIQDALTGK